MTILYNSDNHSTATQGLRAEFDSVIESELNRFGAQVSNVHVYLSDTNGSKNAPNDKQVTLEVRAEGIKNLAVAGNGDTFYQALRNALEKLKHSLDTLYSKRRNMDAPDLTEQ